MGLKLIGEVALDGSGFERGLNAMAGSVKGFIAGAFGIYAVDSMIRKTVDTANELVNASKRLGIGVQQLQLLKQAAKDGGTEFEALTKSFEKLDIAREKALSGSKDGQKLAARFAQLGISIQDLQSKTAADLFMGPIRSKANSMNPEDLGPILRDVLGKSYGASIPVLKTDFEELAEKMRKLGTLVDAETLVKLKNVGDEFDLLSKIIVGILGPALVAFGDWLLKLVSTKGTFLNRVLEGADYKGREAMGMAKLSDFTASNGVVWTAEERAFMAAKMLDYVNVVERERRPISDLGYITEHRREGGMFEDFQGSTYKELNRYLTGLITPVQDVRTAAAKGAEADMAEFADSIKEFNKRMKAEADRLNNPEPPDFPGNGLPPPKEKKPHQFHEQGDALLRVGNFLGSSRSVLEEIGQKQVRLLEQIANNTKPRTGSGNNYPFSDDDFSLT